MLVHQKTARSSEPLLLLHKAVEQGLDALGALLGVALLVVIVVDVCDTEAGDVALGPLKVVEERPGHVALDLAAILGDGGSQSLDVTVEVLGTQGVVEDLLNSLVRLGLDGGTVLGDVDLGVVVALGQPDNEVLEALGVGAQPGALGLGADALAALGPEQALEVAEEVLGLGLGRLVLDVVGSVVVHAVEVVGAQDQSLLLLGEGGKAVAELLQHRVGVLAEVDGVGEPADGELDLAVSGLDVGGVLGVPGVGAVTVEGDADLALVLGLELLAVDLDGAAVGDEEVVADEPGLGGAVTLGRLGAVRGAAGGELADAVAEDGRAPRLVEGDPVLALRDGLEDETGVVLKVKRELGPVQETAVALLESVGQIPVVEGDEGGDASLEQVIDELDVVVNAGLVDGVVAATEGDKAGPAEREAVALGAKALQEGDVLGSAVVRVAGGNTRGAVGDLAGNLAELIPDGRATAILVNGTLNLVTIAKDVVSAVGTLEYVRDKSGSLAIVGDQKDTQGSCPFRRRGSRLNNKRSSSEKRGWCSSVVTCPE